MLFWLLFFLINVFFGLNGKIRFEFDCQKTTRIEFKCGGWAKHQFGELDQDSRMIQIKRARLSDHPAKHGNKKKCFKQIKPTNNAVQYPETNE